MKILAHVLTLAILSSFSTSALALFSGELLVGKRWYEVEGEDETNGVDGQVIHVGAHVDPIPLVPVAIGLGIDTITLDGSDMYPLDVDTATIFEAGIEVKAWIPMVPVVTPYAKINYPVVSTYLAKGKIDVAGEELDYASKGELSGYHLHLGAEMSLIPLMSLMIEVGMGSQDLTITEVELGDNTDDDEESDGANSQSFLIGIKVGI